MTDTSNQQLSEMEADFVRNRVDHDPLKPEGAPKKFADGVCVVKAVLHGMVSYLSHETGSLTGTSLLLSTMQFCYSVQSSLKLEYL